jgi:hypothetical protein
MEPGSYKILEGNQTREKFTMRGKLDHDRQLDALAACIVGREEMKRLAAEWNQSLNSLYQLAHSAIKRLSKGPSK